MICNICESPIENNFGNNPYPLCSKNDNESRCCDICNNRVIKARILSTKYTTKKQYDISDLLVIFYSKNSNSPIESIKDTEKFLAGHVTDIIDDHQYKGDWGNFIVDTNTDNVIYIDE